MRIPSRPPHPGADSRRAPTGWLRARDRGLAASRRAGRAAIVMPGLFALCGQVIGSSSMATFAAFGAFSMLLLVEFTGPMSQRLQAHVVLFLGWAALISLGTVIARFTWASGLCMVAIGFAVLYAGVVSSVLAASATPLLLGFILPLSLPAPVSALPDRLAGAALAAAASMLAIRFLWPRPPADPLSAPAAGVCRAVAVQLRAEAARELDPARAGADVCRTTASDAARAADRLRHVFDATPYRPTGLSTEDRALVRLVDELTWLGGVAAEESAAEAPPAQSAADPGGGPENGSESSPGGGPENRSDGRPEPGGGGEPERGSEGRSGGGDASLSAVKSGAAEVLEHAARLLDDPRGDVEPLRTAARALSADLAALELAVVGRLPDYRPAEGEDGPGVDAFLGSLDGSFRAQELSFVVLQIAANVRRAVLAGRRGWTRRLLGTDDEGPAGALSAAWERAVAHAEPHSVWLHNSVRGAVGLGLAVVTADLTSVQHSFWVVLGALSVLRSNALSTGQNVLRGLAGTVLGSIIGAGLLQLIGHNETLLWFLLPVAVLVAGIAPVAVSFAAGQAAFTVTLVILFNIGQAGGWQVGLLRVEDIALGCAASVVVGLLFWPRGASTAIRKAMAQAYADSADYLARATSYAVARCGAEPAAEPSGSSADAARKAAASARRLDDAFRNYLAERGYKRIPLAEATTLVTGIVGLRLAADAVLGLWHRCGDVPEQNDRAAARAELLDTAARLSHWYHDFAGSLEGGHTVSPGLPPDSGAGARLAAAVRRDLYDEHGTATATAVRIVWTADHLDASRRLQASLAAAAGTASAGPAR
jgi:uncharacterized membrane protein YccC